MERMYLVLVDAHSKWLDVQVMSSITRAVTVGKLRQVFATHGLPRTIVTDSGSVEEKRRWQNSFLIIGSRHIPLLE